MKEIIKSINAVLGVSSFIGMVIMVIVIVWNPEPSNVKLFLTFLTTFVFAIILSKAFDHIEKENKTTEK